MMTNHLQQLPWDSKFFGVPIARITTSTLDEGTMTAVLEEACRAGLRCLYFEVDPQDLTTVLAAEGNGFHLVDVRIVLEYGFQNRPRPVSRSSLSSGISIDKATESDVARLEDIATGIGQFSRYAFDRRFRADDNQRLYRTWIINALHGFADVVLVARSAADHNAPVGLIACGVSEAVGHIQLAGVHPLHRQRGVGTALVQSALEWMRHQDTVEARVVTQARNVPAQRLYQQMGFFTRSITHYYHKWL